MNEREVLEGIRARLTQTGINAPLPDWTVENIYLDSKPFSFDMHPELIQLYSDTHPDIKIRKSVQVGASVYVIATVLHGAIVLHANSMYAGPTDDWIKDFVPTKVDFLIKDSPKIASQVKDVNQTFVKKIGFGVLYFRGLKTENNTASVSCDILIKDEKDLLHQKHAEMVEERLEHSQNAIIRELSKPSYPDFGIDQDFNEGDQHYYMFRCHHCRTYNNVVMNIWNDPENIIICRPRKGQNHYYFACEKCGNPLDPSTGTWVAAYPGRDIRSYQLSQVYWRWAPKKYQNIAHRIYSAYHSIKSQEDKENFWRGKIGLPYAGSNQPLTDAVINKLQGDHSLRPSWPGWSYMGVDNGNKWHWAVAHQQGYRLIFHDFGTVDDAQKLDSIMRKHNVRYCLIDMEPNTHDSKKFVLRHKKRAAVQDFQGKEVKKKETEKEGEKVDKIDLPRTESLDETIDCILGGIIVLPGISAGPEIKEVRKHLKKLIKEKIKNSEGKETYRYLRSVDNHYGMAINNCLHAWYQIQQKITHGSGVMPVGGKIGQTTH